MVDITEIFGSMVFNDAVMKERLPAETYIALRKTQEQGTHLELDLANTVAHAMKEWAMEKGVTHYTHWFQPMTNATAEKHDSFIMPGGGGSVIMEFSGKELVRGEPDASSFPSGGLRATFEARGYTVWDTTSYAFIKDGTLCIPTAFCSYCGEALDKKTPLLRSMDALNTQAMRIVKLFGNEKATRVISSLGPEQEYFLLDKEVYAQRPDLTTTGRTLFGASPSKGQEMDDHYFTNIKPRILAFMEELDEELWKLGVYAKTRHNEVAPAQFELATVYQTTSVSTDHNQLTMELMKNIASRHDLACLLHEKPFAGLNGSGKHNNWSVSTDTGSNLLEPGDTPEENAQFLLMLVAIIKACDVYQDLIRASAASPGNDHRLGGSEAPPAIISMFLGDQLTAILDSIAADTDYENTAETSMTIGVTALPHFPRDVTDRNRTSPFAFTGNKFEFRMPGSSSSLAGPNIVLNTTLAEVLSEFADQLEQSKDFKTDLDALVKKTYQDHRRIVFNGDNYTEEWAQEAKARGLSNLKDTPQALRELTTDKVKDLYEKHKVLNQAELDARTEIFFDGYIKTLQIEAATMLDMTKTMIIPATVYYQNELASLLKSKKEITGFNTSLEADVLQKVSTLSADLLDTWTTLETALEVSRTSDLDSPELAEKIRDEVGTAMASLRETADKLETIVAKDYWPIPTYSELLGSVS